MHHASHHPPKDRLIAVTLKRLRDGTVAGVMPCCCCALAMSVPPPRYHTMKYPRVRTPLALAHRAGARTLVRAAALITHRCLIRRTPSHVQSRKRQCAWGAHVRMKSVPTVSRASFQSSLAANGRDAQLRIRPRPTLASVFLAAPAQRRAARAPSHGGAQSGRGLGGSTRAIAESNFRCASTSFWRLATQCSAHISQNSQAPGLLQTAQIHFMRGSYRD